MATSPIVSAERKRSLLLEARRDRVAWVDAASVPFRSAPDGLVGDAAARERCRRGDEGLQILRSARACASMSSAVEVAKILYSDLTASSTRNSDCDEVDGSTTGASPHNAGERIKWLLESDIRADDLQMAMMSTLAPKPSEKVIANDATSKPEKDEVKEEDQVEQRETLEMVSQHNDKAFISEYYGFLHKLRTPECAELVQAMRRFVNSFEDFARGAADRKSSGDEKDEDIKRMADMIRGHIAKSLDVFKSHPKWTAKVGTSEKKDSVTAAMTTELSCAGLKQSIETFIFSKCHKALWSCIFDGKSAGDDIAFQGRLDDLQFVTPKHLDIHCLTESAADSVIERKKPAKNDGDVIEDILWSDQLSAPIRALQSVDIQYSPARMLSCIHSVYRGVNEALSVAMASAEKSSTTLPSADDVLPALILVVLRAQPRGVISNLNFVDLFATPEQLRGEVGYAFTNLFSAVQFLRELDVDKYLQKRGEDEDSNRLPFFSMSPDEFKKGLEKCREDTQKRIEDKQQAQCSSDKAVNSEPMRLSQIDVSIPVHTIHCARSKGEVVDMEWAQKWQHRHLPLLHPAEAKPGCGFSKQQQRSHVSADPLPLPDGFSRSYNFLSVGPEDVRINDVPQLLHDYQMLVRATESLLSERNTMFTANHKEQLRITRDKLESAVKELD